MSKYGRYPDGVPYKSLSDRFDKDIISELRYYDYLEATDKNLRITVHGREALQAHTLTVVSVSVATLALLVAVLGPFLQ